MATRLVVQDWNGEQIKAAMREAQLAAIDHMALEVIQTAKQETPVATGRARDSITKSAAAATDSGVEQEVGSFGDVPYFAELEIGSKRRPGVRMIRRAIDQEYPGLGKLLTRYLRVKGL